MRLAPAEDEPHPSSSRRDPSPTTINWEARPHVRTLGFDYAVDVKCHTRVVVVGDDAETDTMSVEAAAQVIGAHSYRKVTWREGSRRALSACFAAVRVRVVTDKVDSRDQEQWLVIEKTDRDGPVEHYVLATLPKSMSRKQIVRRIKQRWRTERVYEDLKGELGLDHFEGRSYIGWQHHVSCVLACYAFLVSERARAFPPEARGPRRDDPITRAA